MGTRGAGGRLAISAFVVLVVIAMPEGLARATSTRIYTLGVMNRFIVDDANKWLYPQSILRYGDLFYIELFGSGPSRAATAPGSERNMSAMGPGPGMVGTAGTDLQTYDIADSVPVQQTAGGGAIVKITDEFYLGLHLSDYENPTIPMLLSVLAGSSMGTPNMFPWLTTPPTAPGTANRKLDLFAAYNIVDVIRLGLHLSYGSSHYTRHPNSNDPAVITDPTMMLTEPRQVDDIGSSELGILAGASLDIGDVASIDTALGMKFHGLTYLPNQRNLIGGGGGTELNADVRALIGITRWWELVPALSIRYMNVSAQDLGNYTNGIRYDATGQEYFITDVALHRFVFDLGVAGHFRPTDFVDFWAATGVQFGYWSAQFENKIDDSPPDRVRDQALDFSRDTLSYTALPYFRLAIEARIFSWLDFRGGVVKYLSSQTAKQDQLDKDMMDNNRLNDVVRTQAFFDYFVGAAVHYEGFFLDLQIDPNWFGRGPNFLSGASSPMFLNASLGYRF